MFCTFAVENKLTGGGVVAPGNATLTPFMDVPCIPRVGEEVLLQRDSSSQRHLVTSVRYLVNVEKGMSGAIVFVSKGEPMTVDE